MLFKIRHQCNKNVLRSLYFSLFESHLSFGLPVWGSAKKSLIEKLFLLQKKAIRAITFSDFRAHTSPLFRKMNILKVHDLFEYQVSSIMWDFNHNTAVRWRNDVVVTGSLESHSEKQALKHF